MINLISGEQTQKSKDSSDSHKEVDITKPYRIIVGTDELYQVIIRAGILPEIPDVTGYQEKHVSYGIS